MGGKKIKALYDELGVGTVADLKRVCESGEVAKLGGFGAKSVEKILEAIDFREQNADRFRLGQVAENVETVLDFLRDLPEVNQVEVAGSYRRAKETVHDLDFIVSTKEPEKVMAAFVKIEGVKGVIAQGKTKSSVYLENGVFQVKLLFVLIGGLNAILFYTLPSVRTVLTDLGPGEVAPTMLKAMAGTSLVAWLGVTYLGRMLPYKDAFYFVFWW